MIESVNLTVEHRNEQIWTMESRLNNKIIINDNNRVSETCGLNWKSNICVIKIPEGRSKTVNRTKEKYEDIMHKNFPKLVMTSNHRSKKLKEHQRE